MRTQMKAYNSGVCQICRETRDPSAFAARITPDSMDDLRVICTLDFSEQSCRNEDREYAQQMGYSLDRKISTRRPGTLEINTKFSAVIGKTLYHIGNVEYTPDELYLQLAEVTRFA